MQDQNSHRKFLHAGNQIPPEYFLLLPSTELFLHLVTTLGSSSHLARVQHRPRVPLHNQQDVRDNTEKKLLDMLKQVVTKKNKEA